MDAIIIHERLKGFRGSISSIARKLNMHRNSVRDVLKGKWTNEEVLLTAAEVLLDLEKKKLTQEDRRNNITEKMKELQVA